MASIHPTLSAITAWLEKRSRPSRKTYLDRLNQAKAPLPRSNPRVALLADMASPSVQLRVRKMSADLKNLGADPVSVAVGPPLPDQQTSDLDLTFLHRDLTAMGVFLSLSGGEYDAAIILSRDRDMPAHLIGALATGHLPVLFAPVEEGGAIATALLLQGMGLQIPGSDSMHGDSAGTAMLDTMAAEIVVAAAKDGREKSISTLMTAETLINAVVILRNSGLSGDWIVHLIAIARACGYALNWDDVAEVFSLFPQKHSSGDGQDGNTPIRIDQLLSEGLLHNDVQTIFGRGLDAFTLTPKIEASALSWTKSAPQRRQDIGDTLVKHSALSVIHGPLGKALLLSSDGTDSLTLEAIVFDTITDLITAAEAGELNRDFLAVLPYQGPKAAGLKDVGEVVPVLEMLQQNGFQIALLTDGRLSPFTSSVSCLVQVTPEAASGGPIGKIRTGDRITLDTPANTMTIETVDNRPLAERRSYPPLRNNWASHPLLTSLKETISPATEGASISDSL